MRFTRNINNIKPIEEPETTNEGHYHEIMDRSHIICSMIDEFLIDHPGMTKGMNQRCKRAQDLLVGVGSQAAALMTMVDR